MFNVVMLVFDSNDFLGQNGSIPDRGSVYTTEISGFYNRFLSRFI